VEGLIFGFKHLAIRFRDKCWSSHTSPLHYHT